MTFAWTRRSLLGGIGGIGGAALAWSAGAGISRAAPAKPDGAVILTFAGDIGQANRGATDPEVDGFFRFHDIGFERGFAYDRAMLEAFPQTEINCQPPQYKSPATFSGPLLTDVLKAVGAEGASIQTRALDGFAVDLTAEQVAEKEWILATGRDGRPFGIGDQGPLWLINRPAGVKVTAKEEENWPWALFFIQVTG